MAIYKLPPEGWLVLRYYLDGKNEPQRDKVDPTARNLRSTCRKGYVGMCFPMKLYPTVGDLPTHRTEIDLYPEFRRGKT